MLKLVSGSAGIWVHESRVDEYLKAGWSYAPPPPVEKKEPAPAKAPAKKTTTKKK